MLFWHAKRDCFGTRAFECTSVPILKLKRGRWVKHLRINVERTRFACKWWGVAPKIQSSKNQKPWKSKNITMKSSNTLKSKVPKSKTKQISLIYKVQQSISKNPNFGEPSRLCARRPPPPSPSLPSLSPSPSLPLPLPLPLPLTYLLSYLLSYLLAHLFAYLLTYLLIYFHSKSPTKFLTDLFLHQALILNVWLYEPGHTCHLYIYTYTYPHSANKWICKQQTNWFGYEISASGPR